MRPFHVSATQTLPCASSARPTSSLNWPGALPTPPNMRLKLPSRPKTCTRLLPVSVTYTSPAGLMAIERGPQKTPWSAVGAALGIAQTAPLAEELAGRVEVLDAMVPGVGDVDVAVRRHGDAPRLLELAVALARAAPGGGDAAVGIERGHARAPTLDHVQLAVGRHGDVLRVGQHRATVGGAAVDACCRRPAFAAPRRRQPAAAAAGCPAAAGASGAPAAAPPSGAGPSAGISLLTQNSISRAPDVARRLAVQQELQQLQAVVRIGQRLADHVEAQPRHLEAMRADRRSRACRWRRRPCSPRGTRR